MEEGLVHIQQKKSTQAGIERGLEDHDTIIVFFI